MCIAGQVQSSVQIENTGGMGVLLMHFELACDFYSCILESFHGRDKIEFCFRRQVFRFPVECSHTTVSEQTVVLMGQTTFQSK